jgi:phenylalanyl-tRNA synthetase beta chain
MRFTFNWLKDHLQTDLSYQEIEDKLVNLGIEVESVVDGSEDFKGFVVGCIKDTGRHPNADKLQICKVDVGGDILEIVCGAENVRPGIRVVVAKDGTIIPSFGSVLYKSTIRGVESNGMMCSANELMLKDHDSNGILELSTGAIVGENPAKSLGLDEVVFDVSITPNRADCFSVRGIARDLAAAGAGRLLPLRDLGDIIRVTDNNVGVDIQTEDCLYFSTLAIEGITGELHEYIKKRLSAIGQKLIHLPVDIANYVCLDIGQPLHIFDLDKVSDGIAVRIAKAGTRLSALNGKEIIFNGHEVVVASKEGEPLSVAGVIGGVESSFSEGSRNILIEGAFFRKTAIARSGQALNIQSDSRTRFERGVDPQMVDYAVRYVACLLGEVCDCRTSFIKKCGQLPENKNIVNVSFSKFSALAGLSTSDFENGVETLKNLGMTVISSSPSKISVETPSWRHDLTIEEDIIEEILRIFGYENIEDEEIDNCAPLIETDITDTISDALVFNGYHEIKTFSLVKLRVAEMFAKADEVIAIKNPMTVDFAVMRPSIIASHLRIIKMSQNKSQYNNRVFEAGRQYTKKDGGLNEVPVVCATLSGERTRKTWRHPREIISIFDLKKDLECILGSVIRLHDFRLQMGGAEYYHPGRSGTYVSREGNVIAYIGEVHPAILSEMCIAGPVVCLELFTDMLSDVGCKTSECCPVFSQYQSTSRDFSFIINKLIAVGDILESIKGLRLEYVKDVGVFDIYESNEIGDQNKAVALKVIMQSDRATLSDEDISNASSSIVEVISKNHGGILRDRSIPC